MKFSFRRRLVPAAMTAALIVLFISYYIHVLLITPYKGYAEQMVAVTIKPGTSLAFIVRTLHEKGVVRFPWLLEATFRVKGTSGQSKAGDYVFDRPMTPLEVYDKLMKGEVLYRVVTIPEGSNLFDIESELLSQGIADPIEFHQALQSTEMMQDLHSIDPQLQQPEGFLFPETYFLAKHDSAIRLVHMMLQEFGKRYEGAEKKRAKELGMTTLQVITLASLIEKEAKQSLERSLISGVFHNRMKRSMLLQSDPTVIYALLLNGSFRGQIYKSDLHFPSPYNTYVTPGLPPGPICSPGRAAIEAALYPQETDKMYFVARNDGTHYFSATLEEHNHAVRMYQRN